MKESRGLLDPEVIAAMNRNATEAGVEIRKVRDRIVQMWTAALAAKEES